MLKRLPIFQGYFVDIKLNQFRKVTNQKIEFVDFNSVKGKRIFNKYIKSLNPKSE